MDALGVLPQRYEHFLRDVTCELVVAGDSACQAENQTTVPVIDRGQRPVITDTHPLEQHAVVVSDCTHVPNATSVSKGTIHVAHSAPTDRWITETLRSVTPGSVSPARF